MNKQNIDPSMRPNPFDTQSQKKYGFINFDKLDSVPVRQWKGWCSIGGEPSVKFNNIRELPIDIIWWTNLTMSEFWSLGRYKKFKPENFFGISFNDVEMENQIIKNDLELKTRVWSEFFSLTLDQISFILSENNININFYEGLCFEFIKKHVENTNINVDISFERVLDKAYFETINNQLPIDAFEGKRSMSLSKPRALYFKEILNSFEYPSGNWISVPKDKLPEENNKRINFIKNNKKFPMLINISNIKYKDGEQWGLNNSGYLFIGDRLNNLVNDDVWLTHEEVNILLEYASFNVNNILTNDKYKKIENTLLMNLVDYKNKFFNNSVVKQLMVSSSFYAMSAKSRDPQTRVKFKITPKELWLKSYENIQCFKMADDFQKNGFPITNYGNGKITFVYDKNINMNKLKELIIKHGLIMPTKLNSVKSINPLKGKIGNIDNVSDLAIFNQWIQFNWNNYADNNNNEPIALYLDRLAYFYNGKNNEEKLVSLINTLRKIVDFNNNIIVDAETKDKKDLFEKVYKEQTKINSELFKQ